jgi:uncharacterized protein (TIGR02246 family)
MRAMKISLAVAAGSLLLAAMVEAQAGKKATAIVQAGPLASLRKEWVAAANAKDTAKVTSLYTDDAVLMPPNSPMAKGHAAIEGVWKGLIDQGARNIVLAPIGVAASGDMAYEAGTYTFMMNGPGGSPASDKGKYLMTAHRGADGKWLITYDIFNSDLPCPAPAGR